jgi:membrane AbrB-like protein
VSGRLTLIAFPVLLTCWVPGCAEKGDNIEDNSKDGPGKTSVIDKIKCVNPSNWLRSLGQIDRKETVIFLWWVLLTLAVASGGGLFLSSLGVPAGIMVGAMLFTAIASLLGAGMKAPTSSIFNLLLIGVGITISNSITPETLSVLRSGNLLLIILISTLVIFLSSLVVAFVISKVTGWDYATSFLAAAPAGFTVMTMLAVKYDKDPFRVSILHLCRLISLKVAIPLYFMFADKV